MAKICVVDGCPEIRPCPVHKPKRSPSSQATSERGWRRLRSRVLWRDNYTCHICGEYGNQVDHVVPASYGGESSSENLRAICQKCNREKSNG